MKELAQPEVIGTIAELRARLRSLHPTSQGARARVVLVPTMGALHAGHLALVRRANELGEVVVVSIFVNPLQFGPDEDLDTYPCTLKEDVAALAEAGAQFVFAPSAREMYPDRFTGTRVSAGRVGTLYEGSSRPEHFDGMLTVVVKLLNIVRPDTAVFGQKDAQQVFLVRRMAVELNFESSIEVVATVREPGGLALSSRNRNLDQTQREGARALSAALEAAASVATGGAPAAIAAARSVIEAQPVVKLDYLVVVNPQTFLPVDDDHRGPARMLVAARVGTTRLIDNAALELT